MFRPETSLGGVEIVASCVPARADAALIDRIIAAYCGAQAHTENDASFWSNAFGGRKAAIHATLMEGHPEAVRAILENPAENDLLYGFDSNSAGCLELYTPIHFQAQARDLYDCILRLGEAVGALPCYYPEGPTSPPPPSLDDALAAIEAEIGAPIAFPQVHATEHGIRNGRGLITYRAIQALFQAVEIRRLLGGLDGQHVIEIGAGLGRTAYHAASLGRCAYTLVDLPLTNVAQAYFIGMALGPDMVALYGERSDAPIRIFPATSFPEMEDRYDIAVNVDSFTEMAGHVAEDYLRRLSQRAPLLLSINHEYNPVRVRDLCRPHLGWAVERTSYWLRPGYVQEIVKFLSS